MIFATMRDAFARIGARFSFAPFSSVLQPLVDETLVEQGKEKYRKGTILTPTLLVWLVLALTLRRDLNCHRVLNWMVSGFRWLRALLPTQSLIVKDGAVSHARVRWGVEVFRVLFYKLTAAFRPIAPDFHGLVSVAFDGSTGTITGIGVKGKLVRDELLQVVRQFQAAQLYFDRDFLTASGTEEQLVVAVSDHFASPRR